MPELFTLDDLLVAAGETIFARGEDYLRYVHGLVVANGSARASIQAKRVYTVELSWAGGVEGVCSCPHSAQGNFCKHLVAVGLAVLNDGNAPCGISEDDALVRHLHGLDRSELAALLSEIIATDEDARRIAQAHAVRSGSAEVLDADELVAAVNDALRTTGFIDYRASFDVAADAERALDHLADLLDGGAADPVRPALERAVTRLRKITEHADDSSGAIGSACQRAADLHARACREGTPDPMKLARWLLKFRFSTPGWPETPLAAYANALTDKALDVYRAGVEKRSRELANVDRWGRFEIDRMRLELVDHDGDVDAAIALLTEGDAEHVRYGAVITRLRAAGRDREVLGWAEQAIDAGRIWERDDEYHLSYDSAVQLLTDAGRLEEALQVRRGAFTRQPGARALAALLGVAAALGIGDQERSRAWQETETAAAKPYGNGAALIDIALDSGELDAAVLAASNYGAGHLWQTLADACTAADQPGVAAELYQDQIEGLLKNANTRNYPTAVGYLIKVRALYAAMGQDPAFASYLDSVREANKRRSSFMAELNRSLGAGRPKA
jgi:uncharacterized Zn finger protein